MVKFLYIKETGNKFDPEIRKTLMHDKNEMNKKEANVEERT